MVRSPPIFRRRNDLFFCDSSSTLNRPQVVQDEPHKTGIFEVMSEFCRKSSIHGLVYLGDRRRRLIERVFWVIAIALSLSLCGYGALDSWRDHGADRIILRDNKKPIPIDSIPFPAVSICPVTKAAAKKFNYTDVYRSLLKLDGENSRNVTAKEFETMKIINQLCEDYQSERITKLFHELYAPENMYRTMMNIAPDLNDTVAFCKLFDKRVSCDKIFVLSLSDDGFCFSFNLLRLSERVTDQVSFNASKIKTVIRASTWNIDDGYNNDVPRHKSYPYRAVDAGLEYSLFVVLKTNNYDIDYLCGGYTQGFKVAFHSPIDTPRGKKHFYNLSPNHAAIYAIEPKFTVTEHKVRQFDPHKRQCYFTTERKLRFSRHYTRFNCISECLTNYTLSQCGCVHFTMPHSNATKICGNAKLKCCSESEKNFHNSDVLEKCDCLESCSVLSYDAYPSTTNFDFVRTLSQTTYDKDLKNVSFSRLIVSFKSEMLVPLVRIENYTWADILSYIGGFCGLFVGTSLVSIVELLYYFTIRAYFRYRNNRNPNGLQQVFPYLP